MMAQETMFLKALSVFQEICAFLIAAGRDGLRLDEVERHVHTRLAQQGLEFLQEYVDRAGNGDAGETVTCEGRVLRRSETPTRRRYLSIFGELGIVRYVYSAGDKRPIEYAPLDARLGLPAGEISYVLEDYQQRLCVKSPFAKGTEDLRAILGTAVSVATAERMNQQLTGFAQEYHLSGLTEERTPPPAEEGELLVVAADGKGVPMRRTLQQRLEAEREAVAEAAGVCEREPSPEEARGEKREHAEKNNKAYGQKKGKKQMAYVGAVYTIDRFRRTADDVLDEIARRERHKKRPRPQHKRVWGEMTRMQEGKRLDGREWLFVELAVACHLRDPERKKRWICLMDGEEPLWTVQEEWLGRAVPILDFFHAMEHLWKVGRVLYDGRAAEAFVEHHARMFLEGKVDYAVRNFGRLMRQQNPRSQKAVELRRAIAYFRHNRDRMRYDEYLAQGYPIGSGVAEGTCRNLVKDRLELTGMKWEHRGAQAMIYLRALYLNEEWDEFVTYRVAKEQEQLYGHDTIYGKLTSYGQAA